MTDWKSDLTDRNPVVVVKNLTKTTAHRNQTNRTAMVIEMKYMTKHNRILAVAVINMTVMSNTRHVKNRAVILLTSQIYDALRETGIFCTWGLHVTTTGTHSP